MIRVPIHIVAARAVATGFFIQLDHVPSYIKVGTWLFQKGQRWRVTNFVPRHNAVLAVPPDTAVGRPALQAFYTVECPAPGSAEAEVHAEDITTTTVMLKSVEPPVTNQPNRALVVFAHGQGLALCYSGDEHVKQFISDVGGSSDTFDTEKCGVDFEYPGDGVFIVDMKLVDDGPGDYPGTREVAIQFTNTRKATKDEWSAHCDALWPWEIT